MSGGVRVIALGSRTACDDEAGLLAAERMQSRAEVVLAGRPGPGLLDLLEADRPTVLVDVIAAGLPAGEVLEVPLSQLPDAAIAGRPVSSHGLGPGESLRLARTLGRSLPDGTFVGIQGECLQPGQGMSAPVTAALPRLVAALESAITRLEEPSDA